MAYVSNQVRQTRATASARKPPTVIVDVHDNNPVDENEALLIYKWLDSLQFSRSRKTAVNRDFADGVMMAEVVANYIPKIINATYYIPTSASGKKVGNWEHLNSKVFKRIGFQLTPDTIKELAAGRSGLAERVLKALQPILFKGSSAVLPVLKRLENVKARFMDFDKTYLRGKTAERPTTAEPNFAPTTPSREESVLKSTTPLLSSSRRSRSRQRTHSRGKSSLPIMEQEITKKSCSSIPKLIKEKCPAAPPLKTLSMFDRYQAGRQQSMGENYEIFTRPSSTGKSLDNTPSPANFAEINNLKEYNVPLTENSNKNSGVPSNNQEFPLRSSWLPVDDETGNHDKDNYNANMLRNTKEKEAEDEIYGQSGYDEDTENEDGATTTDKEDGDADVVFVPSTDATPTRKIRKRRMKRLVKYEYREEYILNGMASLQLPNSAQLEKVRRNYMNPGNTDPNCRGYGFV